MAWQAEANATLEARPSLLSSGELSDGDAEFVVILVVISLECFCGTAAHGGADLPLGAHASPKLSCFGHDGGGKGGRLYQIAAASVGSQCMYLGS